MLCLIYLFKCLYLHPYETLPRANFIFVLLLFIAFKEMIYSNLLHSWAARYNRYMYWHLQEHPESHLFEVEDMRPSLSPDSASDSPRRTDTLHQVSLATRLDCSMDLQMAQ